MLVVGVCAAAWLIGRVLSDRYAWTQPVSWIPTPVLVAPVWAAFGFGLWRARGRRVRARRRGAAAPVRSIGPTLWLAASGLLVLVSAGHLAFVELGLQRVARGRGGSGGGGGPPPLRLVFWNQAGRDVGDISQTFLAPDPTLFVLANRHTRTGTRDLAQTFLDSGEAQAAVGWPFDLFSRLPVERWASTSLGLGGKSRLVNGEKHDDPGWAAWYQVRTPGGPLVVWAIDLPSDPDTARAPLARRAGEAIRAWRGGVHIRRGEQRSTEPAPGVGFPTPDIVLGDFNIPRHSASLREFLRASGAGEMRNAFDVGGVGWQRTWPRTTPVWAIDQCFVGPRLEVGSYATFDPGFGGHRAIVVAVTTAE